MISEYHANFNDHRSLGRGDIKLSICHVTSLNRVARGSCNIMGGFLKFGGYSLCEIGDIKHLICHVTSCDNVIRGSCDIMGGFP